MDFDTVVHIPDKRILFNGTPEETKAYLLANPKIHSDVEVYLGKTRRYMSVRGYLS